MYTVDLNLLDALDVLLAEGSVVGAARRLGLSASAMSRTLERLRRTTGDPLLVRAGRGLVPTPHAMALRERVPSLTREAKSILRPVPIHLDLSTLDQTFTIRAGEWFMEVLAGSVVANITKAAPCVRLRFVPKHEVDSDLLRDGSIDLEIGKFNSSAPEIRTHFLFRDKYVGVARSGHPSVMRGKVTLKRFAACHHVSSLQLGGFVGFVDAALMEEGLKRLVKVVVPGFPDAVRVAASSDLFAVVPRASLADALIQARTSNLEVQEFDIPVPMPEILVSAMWHPRVDADPAQRWLRKTVISVCKSFSPHLEARS